MKTQRLPRDHTGASQRLARVPELAKHAMAMVRRPRRSPLIRLFIRLFAEDVDADFKVVFWNGTTHTFGNGSDFTLHIRDGGTLRRLLADPSMGFGEGYANGGIEVEGDLCRAIATGLRNEGRFAGSASAWGTSVLLSLLQCNLRRFDRRHIARHYDLGNDFYRLWLDRHMVYSCAFFNAADTTLEQAQLQKLRLCCRKLRLEPGESLLDIGCGWGGLALVAAREFGARVTGITLSREQLDFAQRQVVAAGLEDRIRIIYQDYRQLAATQRPYDKIVSVGMFEHVGRANYQAFFRNAVAVLRPKGLFLLHTIGRMMAQPTDAWIRKYIFPGCHIPDLGTIVAQGGRHGLAFLDCQDLRQHYRRTLDCWLERFDAYQEKIVQRFDERFYRMWRCYLAGCSASFAVGNMHCFQVLLSKGVDNDLPMTREWMLAGECPPGSCAG